MSKAKLTMNQVLEEVGLTAKWEARGETRGKFEAALNALNEGSSVDFVHRMTGKMDQIFNLQNLGLPQPVRKDGIKAGPYFEAIIKANPAVFRELMMTDSDVAQTMDLVLVEHGYSAKWDAIGVSRGKFKVARNALNEGSSVDFIQRITRLPLETINKLASDGK
ncbi:hypothetical protein AGMMS49944_28710 [Spirochaetia bacterium]|nr:hypothetical protein AGMMS49944_28710 [Spirochaetia bacterium]